MVSYGVVRFGYTQMAVFDGVLLVDLTAAFGPDRSYIRTWLLKQDFTFVQVRDPESRQVAVALPLADACAAVERRTALGWDVSAPDLHIQPLHPIERIRRMVAKRFLPQADDDDSAPSAEPGAAPPTEAQA